MNLGLNGKTVLITGGSKGIGLGCAKVFLEEGAKVALSSRSHDNLEKAKKNLEAYGLVTIISADLSIPGDAETLIKTLETKWGNVDVLVNSAGAAKQAPVNELSMDSWQAAMNSKYLTYMHTIQAALPVMKRKKVGCIVNIIGQGGKFPLPFHIAGGAANAALMLTTAGLAGVFPPDIRINAVNPGYIKTERLSHILDAKSRDSGVSQHKLEEEISAEIPARRMGKVEDVANMVAFLASPVSSYITGANIPIDGGLFRTI